ncbi:MAG: HepT-like ribonuclease domain-containing protein [Xanthobacteraceae bacterium]
MNVRSPRVWLIDIREEIAGIQGLTRSADLAAFSASWGMKRAVEHALLIIAEAAKNLPQSMKDARPEVPWQKIHGLGNLLRHEYRHIDPEVLWSIVTGPLSDLDTAAVALLEEVEKNVGL